MNEFEQQLKRTGEKLQQLLKQYLLLQKENGKLKQEIQQMANRNDVLSVQSEKWQQQTEILKLSKGEMDETEKKAFEKRLNQYVKEIDRCIALLNE
jgi:DNA-directed RNA polymerase specialized sigma54-like protein